MIWKKRPIEKEIAALNSNVTDMIIVREYTKSYTINAGAGVGIKPSDFNVSIPSGYSVLGLIGWQTNSSDIQPYRTSLYAGLNVNMLFLNNMGSSQFNGNVTISMAFIKTVALGN